MAKEAGLDLIVINPSFVLGPVLTNQAFSTSIQLMKVHHLQVHPLIISMLAPPHLSMLCMSCATIDHPQCTFLREKKRLPARLGIRRGGPFRGNCTGTKVRLSNTQLPSLHTSQKIRGFTEQPAMLRILTRK